MEKCGKGRLELFFEGFNEVSIQPEVLQAALERFEDIRGDLGEGAVVQVKSVRLETHEGPRSELQHVVVVEEQVL